MFPSQCICCIYMSFLGDRVVECTYKTRELHINTWLSADKYLTIYFFCNMCQIVSCETATEKCVDCSGFRSNTKWINVFFWFGSSSPVFWNNGTNGGFTHHCLYTSGYLNWNKKKWREGTFWIQRNPCFIFVIVLSMTPWLRCCFPKSVDFLLCAVIKVYSTVVFACY